MISQYKLRDFVVITGTATADKVPVPECIAQVALEAYKTIQDGEWFHYVCPIHWTLEEVWANGLVPARLSQMRFWDGVESFDVIATWDKLLGSQETESWNELDEGWDELL